MDVLHVDMDAFFASVEQRDRPELRGKPVIVGSGPHERGVVSTCSYEARRYGVHSAMPSREAFRRCPQGIFLYPDMDRYMKVSAQVFEIFERYTPAIEGISCDEAFLDVSGAKLLFGEPVEIARRIRADIAGELHLTASVGVARNKFLAKLASDLKKPDGLTVVPVEDDKVAAFLAPLPVGRIFGVGKVLGENLAAHSIRTIGDIQTAPAGSLERWIGERTAATLRALSFGLDNREVEGSGPRKSISREHTFLEDESDPTVVREQLLLLASDVSRQVRAAERWADTAHLKLRTSDFKTITRQHPFPRASQDDFSFREIADALFSENRPSSPVRLIGFGVSGFSDKRPEAMPSLFGPDPEDKLAAKRESLSAAMDKIRASLGPEAIKIQGKG